MTTKKLRTNNAWNTIGKILVFIIISMLISFVIMQFRSTWEGPEITVSYPIAGQTIYKPILSISGTATHIAQLTIQGAPVPLVLKSNSFWAETSIPLGVSEITIDGYSRSGKHTRKIIPIYYQKIENDDSISPEIKLLEILKPAEAPFRATSDLLEAAQNLERQ